MRTKNSLKSVSIAAFLMATIFVLPTAIAGVSTFHANGASASAYFCTEGGTLCLWLGVDRGGPAGEVQTSLNYTLAYYDPNTAIVTSFSGYGPIPNSAFRVNAKAGSLNIDTRSLAGFVNEACTYNNNTGEFSCDPAPGGVVAGSLTALPVEYTSTSSGTWTYSYPWFKYRATGTSRGAAASANFSILGVAASGGGWLGTNHNTSITTEIP